MHLTKDSIISEIIKGNPERALILDKYEIEFYNSADLSLTEVCKNKNIDLEFLIKELEKLEEGRSLLQNWENWSLDFLITYIVNNHNSHIRSILNRESTIVIVNHLRKKEIPNPSIIELFEFLDIHLSKEEKMIFPYIKKLDLIYNNGLSFEYANFGSLINPVRVISKEHSEICRLIEMVTDDKNKFKYYASNEMASALSNILEDLKRDFHIHVYIEENLIFPRAIALEESLINNNFNLSQN